MRPRLRFANVLVVCFCLWWAAPLESSTVSVRFIGAIAFVSTSSPPAVWALMVNGGDKRLLPTSLSTLPDLHLHVGAIRIKKEFIDPSDPLAGRDFIEPLRGRDVALDGTLTSPLVDAAIRAVDGGLFHMSRDNPNHMKICSQCLQVKPGVATPVLAGRMRLLHGTFFEQCIMKHSVGEGEDVHWALKGKERFPVAQEVYARSTFDGPLYIRLLDPVTGIASLSVRLKPQSGRVKIDVISVPIDALSSFEGACGDHLDDPSALESVPVDADAGDLLDHFAWFYLLSSAYNPANIVDLEIPKVTSEGESGGHPYCTHAVFVE